MAEGQTNRVKIDGIFFTGGVQSYVDPAIIQDQQFRWAVNMVNRGGLVQTRPGIDTVLDLSYINPIYRPVGDMPEPVFTNPYVPDACDGSVYTGPYYRSATATPNTTGIPDVAMFKGQNPQFLAPFSPDGKNFYLVFGIDGLVFASKANDNGSFGVPSQLRNLLFSHTAKQLMWCVGIQTQTLGGDGVVQNLPAPKPILFIQDGGNSRCGMWDGLVDRHLNPTPEFRVDSGTGPDSGSKIFDPSGNETPPGSWMAWSGNRLWVAQGNLLFASDSGDPTKFTVSAGNISAELPFLTLDEPITGLVDNWASSISQAFLVVTTNKTINAVQSGILDRTTWLNTADFKRKQYSGRGCVAGKSLVTHHGMLWFMDEDGVCKWDQGWTANLTQNLPVVSLEMAYSFYYTKDDLSCACAIGHENYVLTSVPSGSVKNRDTWVYDTQVLVPGQGAWNGVWRGIYPVEWAHCNINGVFRCFALSKDEDGSIRLYESFKGNRADNGQPISWLFESKPGSAGSTFHVGIFRSYWLQLREVYGLVRVKGAYKGTNGTYRSNLDATLVATPGSIGLPDGLQLPYRDLIPQSREVKSLENNGIDLSCGNECQTEDNNPPDRSNYFSILLTGQGRAGIRATRINIAQDTQPSLGECFENEDGYHVKEACGCGQFVDTPLGLDIDNPAKNYLFPDGGRRRQYAPYTPSFCDLDYQVPQPVFSSCTAESASI